MRHATRGSLSDGELIARYRKGDQRAFSLLVSRHKERIFGYLMGMTRDRDVSNDLFQDTWIRVIKALQRERGTYEDTGRFIYWVLRIARNAALDHFRSKGRRDTNGEDATVLERVPDSGPLPDMQLAMQQDYALLSESITRLPQTQREVVLLRQDGMTFKEIAALTDVSINTALGRMRYAIINLRKMMERAAEVRAPASKAA